MVRTCMIIFGTLSSIALLIIFSLIPGYDMNPLFFIIASLPIIIVSPLFSIKDDNINDLEELIKLRQGGNKN